MIKAIAVDLGGVYFLDGTEVFRKKLAEEKGYDPKVLSNLLRSPESLDLRKGLMDDEKFWSWAQAHLPEGYDARLIKQSWYDSYVLDPEMEDLVKKLRENYKVMVFSGNIKSRVEYLDSKYNFRKNFDAEVYSYDCHLLKPDAEFVKVLIKESGFQQQEILYIDNKIGDAEPAVALGVNTVIYTNGNIAPLLEELKKYNIKLD